jgi:hypothetical protein
LSFAKTSSDSLKDAARLGELDGPDVRGVRVEREMRAGLVVVRDVPGQDAALVALSAGPSSVVRSRGRVAVLLYTASLLTEGEVLDRELAAAVTEEREHGDEVTPLAEAGTLKL